MKEFIRNFRKQKVVGILNICSLSLGVMVAVIVGLWSINELSFDKFHKDKDKIYRVIQYFDFNNGRNKGGSVFKPLGEEAAASLPQIETFCRVVSYAMDTKVADKLYPATSILLTDANFFLFFSFGLKEGDPASALDAPGKVVISEDAVKKYFPGQDPIGKSFEVDGTTLTVSGIMKNMPRNSSIQADIVTPFFGWTADDTWGSSDSYITFLKVGNKADLPAIGKEIQQIVYRAIPMFKSFNTEYELEPLAEAHFSSGFWHDPLIKGNKSLVYIFVTVAAVILVISCINFTNLFISTSFIRARAIGIKKTHGAGKRNLVAMFYLETACYVFLAVAIGLALAFLSLPVFNNFVRSQLVIDLSSPTLYGFLIVVFLFTALAAGTFPALYLTRFNPIETISGKFRGKRVSAFQKTLLIIQFTASIALLIVVGFMYMQVDYMIKQDLGFDKENVIYVNGRGDFGRDFKTFRDEMMTEPSIANVTRKNSLPMDWQQGWSIRKNHNDEEETVVEVNYVQDNYFDFMNVPIAQGENPFYLESAGTAMPIILNQKTVDVLGLENPVGQTVVFNGNDAVVKGVIKDLRVQSLTKEAHPQVYRKISDEHWNRVLFFRITGNPQRAIAAIEKRWKQDNPAYPFEYHFLDDAYKQLYTSEMNAGRVLGYAMIITFVISIAGLFAMAYYSTQRRIREICLRKVNGATLKDLLLLLNKDFVLWVLIAFAIASPIAWFALGRWLNNYIVHISLNAAVFLLVGIIAMAIALLTTSYQTWKVANTNPAETLGRGG